jgi:hypothetical protein
MIKLTKKQKKEIVRIEIGNLLGQCSASLFDDSDISEDDSTELVNMVQDYGIKKLKVDDEWIPSGTAIVEYGINKF